MTDINIEHSPGNPTMGLIALKYRLSASKDRDNGRLFSSEPQRIPRHP